MSLRRILMSVLLLCMAQAPAWAQTGHGHQHADERPQGHAQLPTAVPPTGHAHGGGHGMIFAGSEKFPTIAYDEEKPIRAVERVSPPAISGDPHMGRHLAYAADKGACLSCHVLGPDADQPGNVGPDLSTYGRSSRSDAYTFQQVWDARAHNPASAMPPFGTNGILTRHEAMHIVAYLNTLNHHVEPPARSQPPLPNFDVAGEDFTLADMYVARGEALFREAGDNGKPCASCHAAPGREGPGLERAAATYPRYDAGLDRVIGLEQRINVCRTKHQHGTPYPLGGEPSNLLTSYVKYLSRGTPLDVAVDGPAAAALERGKASFLRKAGRLNFSCADCHTGNAGKWLRGQPLSGIAPDGEHSATAATWPRHFIAGHDLGLISLRQRAQHCQIVTQTYPLPLHAQEYTELELYLSSLANGAPMLAPTMSRLSDR